MQVKFTKVLYVEDEVDIPIQAIEEGYGGDIEEALRAEYIVPDDCKIKDIIFEDIEEGRLDCEDKEYLARMYDEAEEDRKILEMQYYRGLM